MKRIITAVLILIILSSSVLAKNLKEVNILSDRLGNVWLELTKLGMEFSQLELYRDSITNQTLAAEVMQNSLAIYVLFCDYEREILIIYPYIKKEEKANVARYIYKRIERKKGDLD